MGSVTGRKTQLRIDGEKVKVAEERGDENG